MPPAYPLESSASSPAETSMRERHAEDEMPVRDDKGMSGNLELDLPSPNPGNLASTTAEPRTTGCHIATDDKSVLARMADLASTPDISLSVEGSTVPVPHAPEWLDEIPEGLEAAESDLHALDSMFLPLPGPLVEAIHDGLSGSDTGAIHFDDASDSQLVASEPPEETELHPTASAPPMEEDCFPTITQASIRQGNNGSHRRSLPIYEP